MSAGMEIGAHTLTHPHLSLLAPADQEREIAARWSSSSAGSASARAGSPTRAATTIRARSPPPETSGSRTPSPPGRAQSAGAERLALARRGVLRRDLRGPAGRFSRRLALAELDGAFDGLRERRRAS